MKTFCTVLLSLILITSNFAQTKETRDVPTFREISYRVPGKLFLRQGSPQKVELEGDQRVLEEIETYMKGDQLIIRDMDDRQWFSWSSSRDKINVYITVVN